MKIIDSRKKEIEIHNTYWPLAVDLFLKWGHNIESDTICVIDVDDITPELSAWGIPWKRASW